MYFLLFLTIGIYARFTDFTETSNVEDTAGMSKHTLKRHNAYYLK